jgi:hypothetical protein
MQPIVAAAFISIARMGALQMRCILSSSNVSKWRWLTLICRR